MTKNNEHKNLNVPDLRFPEFSGEWVETELQDIVPNICSGKDRISNSGEVALYGSTGVIGRTNSASYKENIVLVARVGANAGQMQIGNAPCGVTDNTLVIDAKEWNYYIYYFLQHYNLNRLVFGSGQPLITGGMLKRIKVRYGCKAERNNITRLLCLIDERIATQNKIIEALKLLRDAISGLIFNSMKNEKTILLGNVACISNGSGDVQDSDSIKRDGWYPFFDRSEEQKWFPTYSFNREAIIYAGEGQNFFPRYYKGKFALHQRCYAITDFCECLLPKYCLYFMNTLNSYFIRNAVGSTVPSLRMDMFQKAKIKIPTIERQQEIVSTLDALSLKCENEEIVRALYNTQKSYLLQQLFI
ncbi:restriction endonuclease subunit S [Butyricimonas virosa]|uniref:restriction endonuclease subunit S n=1 Tax=Butyricimonas virosa TaxID=544645 RepID=UPI00241EACA6|nr:restriction endonuclease subunit S [Butyricimonas virosa]MDY6219722.1 restriction endonuclease subunit S [Butyricimonas virosa]